MRATLRLSLLLCALLAAGGCAGSTGAPPATRLVVNPSTLVLASGTREVDVAAYDADQAPIRGDRVRWTSSNPAVAVASRGGLVTAKAPGTATLTATMDRARARVRVTVVPARISVCETASATVCGTWVWQTDRYLGVWEDGATADLVLGRFTDRIVLNRVDYGKNQNFSAVYTGSVNLAARTATGSVVWTASGASHSGTWTAQW